MFAGKGGSRAKSYIYQTAQYTIMEENLKFYHYKCPTTRSTRVAKAHLPDICKLLCPWGAYHGNGNGTL